METVTHTRGDTLPLVLALPPDATAATLMVHTVQNCVQIEGTVSKSRASFAPDGLAPLPPGRVYRTSVLVTHADGTTETIDGFALRIKAGCTASLLVSKIPTS